MSWANIMEVAKVDTLLGREVVSGILSGKNIVLAESGIGMTNAAMTAQKMIDQYNPVGVIFTGIAGGIDSSVQIGDITVAAKWAEHDYGYVGAEGFQPSEIKYYQPYEKKITRSTYFEVGVEFFKAVHRIDSSRLNLKNIGERTPVLLTGGVGVSGNTFIDSKEKRFYLSEKFDAMVVDMESAAVAQVCTVNKLPFIVFRSASDLAGGSGSETADREMEQFFNHAADNSATVVVEFLKQF